MNKRTIATSLLIFFFIQANAQLGVMKLVGNGTKDYKLGYGASTVVAFRVQETDRIRYDLKNGCKNYRRNEDNRAIIYDRGKMIQFVLDTPIY